MVAPLTAVSDWSVTQADNEIVIRFDGLKTGFDTKTVFDRIPRTRIAQLSSDENTLRLSLSCDCVAATFQAPGPYMVIDIAESGVPLEGINVPIATEVGEVTEPTPQGPMPQVPESLPAIAMATTVLPPLPLIRPKTANVPNFSQAALERTTLDTVERQVLTEMQEQLAREFGSAATSGVLIPAPDRALPAIPQLDEPEAKPALPEIVEPRFGPLANIRITSSLDRPAGQRQETIDIGGLSCPPTGALDVLSWGTDEPFATQIAAARDGLYGELDRLNPDAASRLAKSYLYFGFGAEARQIIELDPKLIKAHAQLLAIADILDGLKPRSPSVLYRATDCEPEVILWATLAQPDPVQGAKPDADAALRALSKLPFHLRQILAPALSNKLRAYGDTQGAAQALRSLERAPTPLHAAAKLAKAELHLQKGEADTGTAQLEEMVTENTEQSPAALVALVEAKIAAKQPISAETAALIEAYAQELRETELGPDLRRVHILAMLKSGQFDEAFAANSALGGDANTPAAKNLRAHLLRDLATSADDIVFLEHIFDQQQRDIKDLPASDLTTLAERFLATGFPNRAERTLSHLSPGSMTSDQKRLTARVALALGKPEKAQASLLGLGGDAANALRADAKLMSGAYDEAHALYADNDQAQPAAEAAWMSEDWQGLTPTETPVFGAATRLATSAGNVTSDLTTGMLARSAAALEESEAARQTLADLLGADTLQVQTENEPETVN